MSARFHNSPLVEHDNCVGSAHCGQPMGHDDSRTNPVSRVYVAVKCGDGRRD